VEGFRDIEDRMEEAVVIFDIILVTLICVMAKRAG
jgi:hypothetical protein